MTKYTRVQLIEMLKSNVMKVTFTKANGDTRVMECTLKDSFLPHRMNPPTAPFPHSDEALRVWDINEAGWRSFIIKNVQSIEAAN